MKITEVRFNEINRLISEQILFDHVKKVIKDPQRLYTDTADKDNYAKAWFIKKLWFGSMVVEADKVGADLNVTDAYLLDGLSY